MINDKRFLFFSKVEFVTDKKLPNGRIPLTNHEIFLFRPVSIALHDSNVKTNSD